MKKFTLAFMMVFAVLFVTAQNYNPYVNQAVVSPAPLLPVEYSGTGTVSVNVGNTGTSALYLDPVSPMLIVICLSNGVPNVDPLTPANALTVMSGPGVAWFNWVYNVTTNCYTGTQNQTIPGQSVGNIAILYKVTVNSNQGSAANGLNVNITPPAYTGGQATDDDNASSYTYTEVRDYGDAPTAGTSYGSADHYIDLTKAEDGEYYYFMEIGDTIDPESANQASTNADGDDLNGLAPDDEDGVTWPAHIIRGQTNCTIYVDVKIHGYAGGYLRGWVDWNGDGVFNNTAPPSGERIISSAQYTNPTQMGYYVNNAFFVVTVPATAKTSGPIFARFRLGPAAMSPTGSYLYGEVEDYKIQVQTQSDVAITKTDNSPSFGPGNPTVYTVVVTNNGPDDITGAIVTDNAPAGTTITGWTAVFSAGSSGNASGSGNINESINLLNGGTATYTVTLDIPCDYINEHLINTADVAVPFNVYDPNLANNTATDDDVQNIWIGNTADWATASNWSLNVIPGCTPSVGAIIPVVGVGKFYPVISTTPNVTASLTIENGATLTINPGKDLTVCGCTELNGPEALILKSDKTTGNSTFIDEGPVTYPNSGTAKIELYIQDTVECSFCWHAVSSPITDGRTGVFLNDFLKSHDETTGLWSDFIKTTTRHLNVMQGYAVSLVPAANHIKNFIGEMNTGTLLTVDDSVHRTALSASPGYNLVGNPYPSFIDIESAGVYWGGTGEPPIDKKVWFMNASTAQNYQVWAETPTPGIWTGTATYQNHISSMQGFFVHVNEGYTGNTHFGLSNEAREVYAAPWYKYEREVPDQVYLSAKRDNTNLHDDAIVIFNEVTSPAKDQWDVGKIYGGSTAPQLYSLDGQNAKLTLNFMPFAGKTTVVPLNFEVQSDGSTGNYTITASKLESFRAGTTIRLEDKKTGFDQMLTENPVYHFGYTAGEDPARFLLHFYNPFYGIDDNTLSQKQLIIYSYENNIYVKEMTGKVLNGYMVVYDLVGKQVAKRTLTGGTLNKFSMSLEQGYYVVEVFSNDAFYHGKVYLTR